MCQMQQSLRNWHERAPLVLPGCVGFVWQVPLMKYPAMVGAVLVSTFRADLGWQVRRYEMGLDTKSWYLRSSFLLFPGSHCSVLCAAGGNCLNSELPDSCSYFPSAISCCLPLAPHTLVKALAPLTATSLPVLPMTVFNSEPYDFGVGY